MKLLTFFNVLMYPDGIRIPNTDTKKERLWDRFLKGKKCRNVEEDVKNITIISYSNVPEGYGTVGDTVDILKLEIYNATQFNFVFEYIVITIHDYNWWTPTNLSFAAILHFHIPFR